MSVATEGFSPLKLRSFEISVSTSSSPTNGEPIDAGSYEITASVDMTVLFGVGSGNITATALPANQPAANSPNRSLKLLAGQKSVIELRTSGKIAAIAASSSGTLVVNGPWSPGGVP